MYFASDNTAGVHPAISENLMKHSGGFAASYGASDLDKAVTQIFSKIFEKDVSVFFVATGTAANALALAANSKPGGVAMCHSEAHVIEDECGAPELFTNSGRLAPVDGKFGKIDPNALKKQFAKFDPDFVHHGRPTTVSITQSTEIGTTYSLDEISAISNLCKENNTAFHMDGARFANGLVSLGVSPAEMTWKAGVDFLSFGGTKNGCWCAEALICFEPELAYEIGFIRKRAGQLFSKSRFIAAQFEAYFENDLWLTSAQHANHMSAKLAAKIDQSNCVRLAWPVQTNEVFAIMNVEVAQKLRDKGAVFFEWITPKAHSDLLGDSEQIYRFVTSFATKDKDVDDLISAIQEF